MKIGHVTILIFISLTLFSGVEASFLEKDNSNFQSEKIVTVDSTNFRFSPSEITINEGQVVRFFWSGELLGHNAVEENGLFDSGEPETDVDYSYKFEIGSNGTYEYVCEPHEQMGMIGTIIVNPVNIEEEEEEEIETEDALPGLPFYSAILISIVAAKIHKKE
ncbi:MAG: hypothetical protein CMB47_03680 [Euryarchaeota archaeon]|nr:hypothetical protein [Euryarchaeota archaeon]|tara:strand:- start:3191 stop:3679 length:489 start_codon:yes stop_codon:yes gene_type:complete